MNTQRHLRVREPTPAYGPHEADAEPYPGATVLEDLTTAGREEIGRVVARYAAVRCRLLQDADAHPTLVRHGRAAADVYLDASPSGPERSALRALAFGAGPAAAWDAGGAAARSGHTEGAFALYRAGYLAARRTGERRWAATLAASASVLLEEAGLDGAELWAERARRLRLAGP